MSMKKNLPKGRGRTATPSENYRAALGRFVAELAPIIGKFLADESVRFAERERVQPKPVRSRRKK
jgi:hypothetical protein